MASRRRNQEEKNLRTLRELASLPANKQCFDCNQRGPTYVNVTIGSFVCTSCSGSLRGLNPPHRVKSITMTTFTPEEIELIRSKGNKYCRYVWLGLQTPDEGADSFPGIRDEQKIRDHMVQVYEKKKWYVDPMVALRKMQLEESTAAAAAPAPTSATMVAPPQVISSSNTTSSSTLPKFKQSFTNSTECKPLVIQNSQSQPLSLWPSSTGPQPTTTTTSHSQGSLDLLAELGGDLFSSPAPAVAVAPPTVPPQSQMETANGNFANFESAFNTPPAAEPQQPPPPPPHQPVAAAAATTTTNGNNNSVNNNVVIPSADRYAALADLDSLFHCSSTPFPTAPPPSLSAPPTSTVAPPPTLKNDLFIENFNDLIISDKVAAPPSSSNPFNMAPSSQQQQHSLWGSSPTNPFQAPANLNNRELPQPPGGSVLMPASTHNGLQQQQQNGGWPAWPSQKPADIWPPAPLTSTINPFLGTTTGSNNPGSNPFL